MATEKKLPSWLVINDDGSATVTLSRPREFNTVKTDKVTLREPTVKDWRAAKLMHKDDKEALEVTLLASLAGCAPSDIDGVSMRDYGRLQEGYFRLSADIND